MPNAIPIYLVGMMGVGKTTVGARLANRLGRSFIDTDREVERVVGRSISEIFATEGEARFRALEAEAIQRVSGTSAVVALGGGAIATPGTLEQLLASGDVVYLKANAETLIARVGDPSSRPLLAGLDRPAQIAKLESLVAKREPFYRQAKVEIDASGTTEEVVDRILQGLGLDDGTQ